MARRLGKKKRPLKEKYQHRERSKTWERSIDDKTLSMLYYLLNNHVISSLDFPISQGKEAVVFKATKRTEKGNIDLAVKIFKYETSSFLKGSMLKYIQGDPRFYTAKKSHRALVQLWARKEYSNLLECQKAGVSAPRPLKHRENIVVMEFLGENAVPYSLLKDQPDIDAEKILEQVIENMQKLWHAGLVHADLNEFNIMMNGDKPILIDFAQCVKKEHPLATQFLQQDCYNIAKFFSKRGAKTSAEEVLASVLKG